MGDNGTILATDDGGSTWLAQQSGTGWTLACVSLPDPSHAWAVGTGGMILATSTGGWAPPTARVSGAVNNGWYNRTLDISLDGGGEAARDEYRIDHLRT